MKFIDVSNFDRLPASAYIGVPYLAQLTGRGVSTIWNQARTNPAFPRLYRLSEGCSRFNVGEVREFLKRAQEAAAKRQAAEV